MSEDYKEGDKLVGPYGVKCEFVAPSRFEHDPGSQLLSEPCAILRTDSGRIIAVSWVTLAERYTPYVVPLVEGDMWKPKPTCNYSYHRKVLRVDGRTVVAADKAPGAVSGGYLGDAFDRQWFVANFEKVGD